MKPSTCTHAHAPVKCQRMCCMKQTLRWQDAPANKPERQCLHRLHGFFWVPEKQATNSSTTSKAWGAAPLPAKKPHTCPVLSHLLVRPVQLLQTSLPLLMYWTCWIHVTDKVFLKTTSWLKEKNNFGCLGFAQLALLAPVSVLWERSEVISTLRCNCVRPAACLLYQIPRGDNQNSNHTGMWEVPWPTPAHKQNLPRAFSQTQNEIQATLHHSHESS